MIEFHICKTGVCQPWLTHYIMKDRHNRKTTRNQESNESTMKGEVVERKDLTSLREGLEWKGKTKK